MEKGKRGKKQHQIEWLDSEHTESPRASKASTKWRPRNPHPPVTRYFGDGWSSCIQIKKKMNRGKVESIITITISARLKSVERRGRKGGETNRQTNTKNMKKVEAQFKKKKMDRKQSEHKHTPTYK